VIFPTTIPYERGHRDVVDGAGMPTSYGMAPQRSVPIRAATMNPEGDRVMNFKAKIIVSAAFFALSAPAFAHGGGIGDHDRDHHNFMNWQYDKTTETIDKTDKTHTTHLNTFEFHDVSRIEREIQRLRFELVKLRLEGRSDSLAAGLLRFQLEALGKQLALLNS
jgi:hypothetical protein